MVSLHLSTVVCRGVCPHAFKVRNDNSWLALVLVTSIIMSATNAIGKRNALLASCISKDVGQFHLFARELVLEVVIAEYTKHERVLPAD